MTQALKAHIICEGRVQGIGFRWFVRDSARQLGICGWVKNLPDGKVEIDAVMEEEILNKFLEVLKKGNGISKIVNIKTETYKEKEMNKKSEFTIKF